MIKVIQEKTIVENKSRAIQLEHSKTRTKIMGGFSRKPTILAIKEKDAHLTNTRPCVLVEISAKAKTEIALFDTGALTRERISMH